MAKGKYYPPEFKEQAVTMVAGLDGTYDLLHAVQGQPFRLDAHPDRSRSASPRRGQTPGMTAAGSRPSRTGRVAAPDCLTHMCHHVHAADQRSTYTWRCRGPMTTAPCPALPWHRVSCRQPQRSAADQSHNARDQAIQFQAAKLRREFARNNEQQKTLLGASNEQIEEGVSTHKAAICSLTPTSAYYEL